MANIIINLKSWYLVNEMHWNIVCCTAVYHNFCNHKLQVDLECFNLQKIWGVFKTSVYHDHAFILCSLSSAAGSLPFLRPLLTGLFVIYCLAKNLFLNLIMPSPILWCLGEFTWPLIALLSRIGLIWCNLYLKCPSESLSSVVI